MMLIGTLPESSRVWMCGAQRRITAAELESLRIQLQQFVNGWQAHGVDLVAGFEILLDAVIVVAVDENQEPPSGCSIDKVFNLLKLQHEISQLDFFQRTLLWTLKGDDLCILDQKAVLEAYQMGEIEASTSVVNMLPKDLGELRRSFWIPISDSWIGKKLKREQNN